jgi:hypothetical protein
MGMLRRLVAPVVALLCLFLGSRLGLAAQVAPTSVAYGPRPEHLWNQLNAALFARVAPDGVVYGLHELDILYWQNTEHLLTEPSHSVALQALDQFIRAAAERLIRDPLKRALLQRDLWELFDWAAMPGQTTHLPQRLELEDRLAIIIRRLALTDVEIAALPDSYAKTAPHPNLPQGLFAPDSDWITARSNDSRFGSLASRHIAAFNGHSAFLVMVHLPQGRQNTVDYLDSLRDFEGPLVYARQQSPGNRLHYLTLSPEVPQFPVGTEWALVRRLCVIDHQGQIRPTSLIESIQLRRYDSIGTLRVSSDGAGAASAKPAQQMFEFELDRLHEGALKAVTPDEKDFQFVHFMSQGGDPFEEPFNNERTPSPTAARRPTLATCHQCHTQAGIQSVASFFFGGTVQRLQATPDLPPETERAPELSPNAQQEIEATVLWKYRQYDWGLLQGLWRRAQ